VSMKHLPGPVGTAGTSGGRFLLQDETPTTSRAANKSGIRTARSLSVKPPVTPGQSSAGPAL
jgi:hypothetical protein